ncbi:MAG: hypothetical protein JW395_1529 [Nitrospira sp.]|nr:hypothetical protein [Nitrospira sp.]
MNWIAVKLRVWIAGFVESLLAPPRRFKTAIVERVSAAWYAIGRTIRNAVRFVGRVLVITLAVLIGVPATLALSVFLMGVARDGVAWMRRPDPLPPQAVYQPAPPVDEVEKPQQVVEKPEPVVEPAEEPPPETVTSGDSSSDSSDSAPTYSGGSDSSRTYGPVQVKGHYRKNGSYVKPHTRSRPRR